MTYLFLTLPKSSFVYEKQESTIYRLYLYNKLYHFKYLVF